MQRLFYAVVIFAAILAFSCAVVGVFIYLPGLLWGAEASKWGILTFGAIVLAAALWMIAGSFTE